MKKGDKIDIIKKEEDPISLVGWSTGNVEEKSENTLKVSYDGEPEACDKNISINSNEISPYGTHTFGKEWRDNLIKNSNCDCLDTAATWLRATVLEIKSQKVENSTREIKNVKVGYRFYDVNGEKVDPEGRSFYGWGLKYDEWLNAFSLRVQNANTLGKIGVIKCKKSEDTEEKMLPDDTSDVLLNSINSKEIFAIPRQERLKCVLLVQLLNLFGQEGGFDKILSRIKSRDKILSFELAYYYIDIIGILWNWFHRKFAQKYIPQLQEAIISYFTTAPDVEIRKVQKERLDKTIKNLENLLRRVYTVFDRHQIVELFELNIYTSFLKSNYLQRRIEGLKGLIDICRDVQKYCSHAITHDMLTEWLVKQNILEELCGSRKHQQIVQRSAPILSFMYEAKLLTEKELETIWQYTKDDQLRQDMLKVITEIGFPLQSNELEFFASKIITMEPSEICEEALDIIYEPAKFPGKTVEQLLKYAKLLEEIAFKKTYPIAISEKSLTKYAEVISSLEFDPHKKQILHECVENKLKKVIYYIILKYRMIIQFSHLNL